MPLIKILNSKVLSMDFLMPHKPYFLPTSLPTSPNDLGKEVKYADYCFGRGAQLAVCKQGSHPPLTTCNLTSLLPR